MNVRFRVNSLRILQIDSCQDGDISKVWQIKVGETRNLNLPAPASDTGFI